MINHRQTYTKLISITFLYSALLILLLVPAASLAQQDDLAKIDCSVPQGLKGVRPRSGGPPEEIKIGLYVIEEVRIFVARPDSWSRCRSG